MCLEFAADVGLHIVLGANEAGKSTALAAIGDGLFGFPNRTPYAFVHDQSELRVGLELVSPTRRATFFRRKRRKDDLTDAGGDPLPESALIALRGSTDRAFFESMFGLNGAELRDGGDKILKGGGEVGAAIFQASSGLHGLPAALARLKEQADALYSPRRVASRAFYQMTDAYKEARHDLDARSVRPDAYETTRAEADRLLAARAANAAEERTLHAERRRLERIRRTLPALRAHSNARAEMVALGAIPALPEDADAQRVAAIVQRETAMEALARDRAKRDDLAALHDALAPDASLLAEAEAVDSLAQDLRRIDSARGDLAKQQIVAARHAETLGRLAHDLGVAGSASDVMATLPNTLARASLRRSVTDHAAIAQRLASAQAARATARHDAATAEAALAASEAPQDLLPLRRAIDAAKAEGRLDDDAAAAHDELAAARAALGRALAALPLWHDDAAALAAAPVPSPASLRQHAAALTAADTALRDARKEVTRLAGERARADDRLVEIAHGEDLPTEAAIAAVRDRRDRAWRLIRRRIEDGAAATDDLEAVSKGADLADAFDVLLRDADRLADRRTTAAKRISDYEQTQAARARLDAEHARASRALEAAEAAATEVQAAWHAEWAPTGLVPGDPAAMGEWLVLRKAALDALDAVERGTRRVDAIDARRSAAIRDLAAHVPDGARPDGRLGPLLRAAESLWSARDAAARAHLDRVASAAQARAAAEKAERVHSDAEAARAAWRSGWADTLAAVRLPAATDPADAETALTLWERISAEAQHWHAADQRVAEMSADIESFRIRMHELAHRVAPDLAEQPASDAVAVLALRLAAAREVAAEKARHAKALDALDEDLAKAAERRDAAEGRLSALRSLAGAADDAELAESIERVRHHADLVREIERCEAELRKQGDGLPLATLATDAVDADPNSLAGRIDEIDASLAAANAQNIDATRRLTGLETELTRMEGGQNAAEAAQRMENLAAEAADIAGRYARIRLAGELLRAGLDRFRKQQQGPLLRRAGAHFAALTATRYDRLEVIEDDRADLAIIAVRPDGTRCPVDALSEGTRDQLYLALRIAAIEDYAQRADPLPFIADDLLVNFDDDRARAALRVLADLGGVTQTILFTHHEHIAAMVEPGMGHVHRLPAFTPRPAKTLAAADT